MQRHPYISLIPGIIAGGLMAAHAWATGVTAPGYAYVTNLYDGSISTFAIDAAGRLQPRITLPAGPSPRGVAAAYGMLYVIDIEAHSLTSYSIDPASGIPGAHVPPIATGRSPEAVAVDPLGQYVYVANADSGDVSAYRIIDKTGRLQADGRYPADAYPTGIGIDPCGRTLYVTNYLADTITIYAIERDNGALRAIGTSVTGNNPASVAIDPQGRFLFVANGIGSTISSYRIDSTTGMLAPTGMIPAPSYPYAIAIDPNGKYLYTANFGSDDITLYDIQPDSGTVTSRGNTPAGIGPFSIVMHPSGRYLYTTSVRSSSIDSYGIDPNNGMLTPLQSLQGEPGSIAITIADAVIPMHRPPHCR